MDDPKTARSLNFADTPEPVAQPQPTLPVAEPSELYKRVASNVFPTTQVTPGKWTIKNKRSRNA